jgi:hypothetical protein
MRMSAVKDSRRRARQKQKEISLSRSSENKIRERNYAGDYLQISSSIIELDGIYYFFR